MDISLNTVEAENTKVKKSSHGFLLFYAVFVTVLLGLSAYFLNYVWESIELYENTLPEKVIENELQRLKAGEDFELIQYPQLEISEFTSSDIVREQYEDILITAPLTYQFAKEDYTIGQRYYYLYAQEQMVGKLILQERAEENRLGFLKISYMEPVSLEPALDITTWSCSVKAFSNQRVFLNGVEVSEGYLLGQKEEAEEFAYLYDYVDLPMIVSYQIDQLYEKPEIQVLDSDGNEVPFTQNGLQVDATAFGESEDTVPAQIMQEIDILQAAKDWSCFTTKDLSGPSYGLATARQHFIKDSYLWQKLGEYAHSIDITFVSGHDRNNTFFTDEEVSEFRRYTDDCFSCRVHFNKHMLLNTGKKQIDKTDSYFYFVRIDETDDGIDNPLWKIADIQAVTAN